MKRFKYSFFVLLPILFGVFACQGKTEALSFDGNRAHDLVAQQIEFGPRFPGSEGHQEIQTWIVQLLNEAGWDVTFQDFDYYGMVGTNIIAYREPELSQDSEKWIILGAHYDTRLYADNDPNPNMWGQPVPGANDGASGVAVLLELARVLPEIENKNVWLVFFDGEDNGNIGNQDWIQGSAYFADQLTNFPDQVVIIDMIGDEDQNIYLEKTSDQVLSAEIWDVANQLGIDTFIQEQKYAILDDHTPFLNKGISAVDIIDFDYPYWHTTADTLDKISPESLMNVGNVLFSWLGTP